MFALNVIEIQFLMSVNYFLMLSNPKDGIIYILLMFYYCCQTVRYFKCSVLLTYMIY